MRWVQELGVAAQVELLPKQTRAQMADLFRRRAVVVSPTTHDGTPNTLLEAMACGCLPVVGDLESLREWITPGVNGLLVDLRHPAGAGPGDPDCPAAGRLVPAGARREPAPDRRAGGVRACHACGGTVLSRADPGRPERLRRGLTISGATGDWLLQLGQVLAHGLDHADKRLARSGGGDIFIQH